jgi:hypothetical protein
VCTAVAAVVLVGWAWSISDSGIWPSYRNGVAVRRGGLFVILSAPMPRIDYDRYDPIGTPREWMEYVKFITDRGWHWTDFYVRTWSPPRQVAARAPLWALLLVAAVPAAVLWRRDIVIRLRGPGLCTSCGYDRRGIAVHAPCPECGAAAKTS